MSFLSPLMLLGLVGAAIPIAVHLQGRRKAKVVPFAALEFLLGSDKRLAKRLVLRQVLLLAFRVLICAVAALVLARPVTSCKSNGPDVVRGPQAAVLVIDDSAASRYKIGGATLLSRSLQSAAQLVQQLGPEADIAILTTTGHGTEELTRDHLGLRETLNSIAAGYQRGHGERALQQAFSLLSGAGHQKKTVFVLGAPTRTLFPNALRAPSDIALRVLSPAGDKELPNLAVTEVSVQADSAIGSRGLQIEATVANHSSTGAVAKLSLWIGNEVIARGELGIGPDESKKKRFSANLEADVRTTEIRVQLEAQELGLAADDTRYVVANARDQVSVLLINGDARSVRHEDEVYYVEAALRPGDRSSSGTTIATATPDDLSSVSLGDFDVIMMANVTALTSEQVEALARWVRAGGGLLVAMGKNVDAERYNRSMAPLLAQSLRSALDLRHGRSRNPEDKLRLAKLELEHPVFSVFAKDAPGLYSATFSQVMLLGPTTSVKERKVLARFDNGAAALVEARSEAGTLMLFTSTLDRDWNDLAIHPGYLPLMQETIRYLAAKPTQNTHRSVEVGTTVPLRIAVGDVRLEVEGPKGARMVLEGERVEGHKTVRLDGVAIPGIYRVRSVDESGVSTARPESTFAANLDPVVSNLRLQDIADLGTAGSAGADEKRSPLRQVELWHAIAALLLLLLLMESVLSVLGRRPQAMVR